MKNTNIFRNLLLSSLALFLLSTSAFAAAIVRKVAQPSSFGLDSTIYQFYNDLGGTAHLDGGSYTTGFRSVTWDEVPDNAVNYSLPGNYYNTAVPRGMVLSSACTNDAFKVSNSFGSGQQLYFGSLNANYAADFRSYSGPRLFSASTGGCNVIDVYFYIPGTKIPATVSGFGVVFADVDVNQSAGIMCFGADGEPVGGEQNAGSYNNGLSFLGVSFDNGERVAHVRIFSGTAALGDVDKSRGGAFDVVVMDNFIYGEPRAIGQHSSDFDGDGASDYSVFRPANGTWYILNSGSNTFISTQFGANGDMPVDGDFDGDSRNDVAVFRPSNGTWYVLKSGSGQFQATQFGANSDKPIAGDYDKDGKSDLAVWRPSTGNYYVLQSSNGAFKATQWGANGDIAIGSNGQ